MKADSVSYRNLMNARANAERKTPPVGARIRALWDYNAAQPGEISFREGDLLTYCSGLWTDGWVTLSLNDAVGIAPVNYLRVERS